MNVHPRRVIVKEVLSGRYGPGSRPVSWDERREGVERIRTIEGEELSLHSTGGQSTPAPAWELLVSAAPVAGSAADPVFGWTLYGIKPQRS